LGAQCLEFLGFLHALDFKLELFFGDFVRSPLKFQSTRDAVGLASGTGAAVALSVVVAATPALATAEPVWAETAAAPPVIPSAILATRLALAGEAIVAPLAGWELCFALPVPRLVAVVVPVFVPRAVTIVVAVAVSVTITISAEARGGLDSRGVLGGRLGRLRRAHQGAAEVRSAAAMLWSVVAPGS
jgi:hypothetical protein